MVDIEPVCELTMVPLQDMKDNPNLDGMPLLQRGQRLSVQPELRNNLLRFYGWQAWMPLICEQVMS